MQHIAGSYLNYGVVIPKNVAAKVAAFEMETKANAKSARLQSTSIQR